MANVLCVHCTYTRIYPNLLVLYHCVRHISKSLLGLVWNCVHNQWTPMGSTRANPYSFRKVYWVRGTCVTQHTGPMIVRPIRRTKQWLSVLLNETSVTTVFETY